MRTYAIIPSGGVGKRIESSLPKQYIQVNGKELIAYTLEVFQNCDQVDEIIIPAQKEYFDLLNSIKTKYGITKLTKIVESGEERQHSVFNALQSISADGNDLIAVHDAARPLLPNEVLLNAIETAKEFNSVIVAIKAKDTLIKGNDFVEGYIDRNEVFYVQTPQIFKFNILSESMITVQKQDFLGFDESILVHKTSNNKIKIVEGSSLNFKVTTNSDLDLFRLIVNIETS
jgi:2-C-methyl-D-erythritol 4-phosphate cytidylyltransferase